MPLIKLILAEDHHLIRAALASFLAQEEDMEIIGEVSGPLAGTVAAAIWA